MPMSARTISGGDDSARAMAWSPSLTAMTLTSSSAKVSSMTRWIVTLSSASRSVCGTLVLSGGIAAKCRGRSLDHPARAGRPESPLHVRPRPRVLVDERDDVLHRRSWQKNALHADVLQLRNVHVGNDPANDD